MSLCTVIGFSCVMLTFASTHLMYTGKTRPPASPSSRMPTFGVLFEFCLGVMSVLDNLLLPPLPSATLYDDSSSPAEGASPCTPTQLPQAAGFTGSGFSFISISENVKIFALITFSDLSSLPSLILDKLSSTPALRP